MNLEEKELLEKVAKQIEQNNDILKGMRSEKRWGAFFKVVYWAVIIIAGLYVWTLLQPVVDSLMQAASEISKAKDGVTSSVSGITDSLKEVTGALDKIKDIGI